MTGAAGGDGGFVGCAVGSAVVPKPIAPAVKPKHDIIRKNPDPRIIDNMSESSNILNES